MLEEDKQGFKPSAVYVTLRQIPGSSSRSGAAPSSFSLSASGIYQFSFCYVRSLGVCAERQPS